MRTGTIMRSLLAGALALTTAGVLAAPAEAAPAGAAPGAAPAGAAPAGAARARADEAGTMTSAVDGTFTDVTGGAGKVTGTFAPTSFAVQNGAVVATGTLHAVLTDAAGTKVGETDAPVTLPVQLPASSGTRIQAACPILHLVLGPLDLNLLGLVVHLNTVVLDITAQSGAGNLLGNLLCAITNLLNGGTGGLPLDLIVQLLNALLGILTL